MDYKILSWNIRGLGDDLKITTIRNAIRRNHASIVTIQETKKELIDDTLVRKLWGNNGCDYVYLPSEGRSGGILVMWNRAILAMEDNLIGAFSVSIKFRNFSDNFNWIFTAVYGVAGPADYAQFWQEIDDIRLLLTDPWLIGGD